MGEKIRVIHEISEPVTGLPGKRAVSDGIGEGCRMNFRRMSLEDPPHPETLSTLLTLSHLPALLPVSAAAAVESKSALSSLS